MAEPSETPGTAPVSDHRPVPRGVLPRNLQTWLMAGLALGIVLIILVAGEPEAPSGPTATAAPQPTANPERLRDYQERLRAMEARQAQEAQGTTPAAPAQPRFEEPAGSRSQDPINADRKRREYESLFSSNVVLSRRPDAERPETGRPAMTSTTPNERDASAPSLDDIAEAVVRATGHGSGTSATGATAPVGLTPSPSGGSEEPSAGANARRTPDHTEPISAASRLHPLLEGTVIDTVLTNRLDGSGTAPVNCLVTNPVYSHSGQHVLIPAGARVLGETRPVQSLGETRLAVAFHRLLMPDGSTQRLDQFLGLNQIGDTGLRDKVNQHYWSMFGSAAAVGLIGGLTQWVGTAGLSGGTGDRTVVIAGGAADGASQASLQVMNRFLNRLPTITIREGHRVKIYLTSDLQLPAYAQADGMARF